MIPSVCCSCGSMKHEKTKSPVHPTPQIEVVPLAHIIENKIWPDHPGRMGLFPGLLASSFATLRAHRSLPSFPGGNGTIEVPRLRSTRLGSRVPSVPEKLLTDRTAQVAPNPMTQNKSETVPATSSSGAFAHRPREHGHAQRILASHCSKKISACFSLLTVLGSLCSPPTGAWTCP